MARTFIQSETEGPRGWTVWKIVGRIDIQTADAAYARGEEIIKNNGKTVLDMTEMEFLSSAGLRVLLRLFTLASTSGKSFTAVGPDDLVRSVLEESGMDELLDVKASLNELE